ncbi:MAG: hypothetical protein EOO90_13220 [Pedobacter sp.]|nr:MAG: hypothetical protein EOO90_13220 [Pedobacter sp.]
MLNPIILPETEAGARTMMEQNLIDSKTSYIILLGNDQQTQNAYEDLRLRLTASDDIYFSVQLIWAKHPSFIKEILKKLTIHISNPQHDFTWLEYTNYLLIGISAGRLMISDRVTRNAYALAPGKVDTCILFTLENAKNEN